MESRHKIKRQVVEVAFRAGTEERAIQDRLSRLFHSRLLPEINRVCDRLNLPNTLHRIDRLEIDLGEVRLNRLERDLEEQFRQAFLPSLEKAIRKAVRTSSASGREERRSSDNGPTSSILRSRSSPQAVSSAWELLHHFAQTGLLPWWADARDAETLEKAVEQLATDPTVKMSTLLSRLLESGTARRRLWRHLNDDSIVQLFQVLVPQAGETTRQFLTWWFEQLPSWSVLLGRSTSKLQRQCWETVYFAVPDQTEPSQLFRQLYLQISFGNAKSKQWQEILERLIEEKPEKPFSTVLKKGLRQLGEKFNSTTPYVKRELEEVVAPSAFRQVESQSKDGLYIFNAGLVILAPFLQQFFGYLEWVADKAFISPERQQRATYLLQYLAAGASEAPEFQLPLNKLLAGLPLETPLEEQEPLTEEEQTAGEELLEAVVQHAANLGLTTVDGLRGSFLLREGVLFRKEKSWTLHVQRETFDILLNRLPWAYQVVKLPWMPEPLLVEW